MENSGGERRVDATDMPESPQRLLDLLITRLAEPAAVLDASLTIVAANDAFGALAGTDREPIGEGLTAISPKLTADTVEGKIDEPGEYVTVRTGRSPDRWTEFGFDRHGSHVLCIGRNVGPERHAGAAGNDADRQARLGTAAELQTATRDLLAAEDEGAVADRIVATATEALGLSGATLYLFDACRNELWPAGAAGHSGADARTAVGGDDDAVVREVFLDGAAATLDGGDRYQSLGDHGVLHTVVSEESASDRRGPGQRDERTEALVDRLAESARVALERVSRESTLRERDARHREQAERAAELERVLSLVRRVHRVLIDADTVSDIESGVCEALTASSWLSFAWIGQAGAGGVEPRAWAGRGSDFLEAVSLATDDPHAPPAVQTAASNQPTTVDAVAQAIREHRWRTAAVARDFQAAISVPIRVDGVSYGTLTAYADEPVEWDDSLTSVFTELGTSVAAAVRDRERRGRLAADADVELDLAVTAPDGPLGRLAAELGSALCCTEAIPVDGTTTRLFVSARGVDGDTVAEAVERVHHVDSIGAVSEEDYELLVREPTVIGRLVRHGGRLDTACVSDGKLTLTLTLAADADVRAFVDRVGDGCGDVKLTARRHQPAATRPQSGIRGALDSVLTDRQLEALRTAYGSGFFEWPRETTGEGVADMLGVAQPTVNRHLRVSQRKLLELVFDDE